MAVLTIKQGDHVLQIDTDSVTPRETRAIKRETGLKWGQVLRGMQPDEFDADSVATMVWLAQRRLDPQMPYPHDAPLGELIGMVDINHDTEDAEADGDEDDPKEAPESKPLKKHKDSGT